MLLTKARSVFDMVPKPVDPRGGKRKHLPALDVATLVFETGKPKPAKGGFATQGQSKYAAVFAALQPGQSVSAPLVYKGALYAAAKKRVGEKYTMRSLNAEQCCLWRDA